jgi:hypothetical protein
MILGTDGRCNDPALGATACPACGALGRFRPHSLYRRNLEDLEGGAITSGKVTIERVRCASCGVTHALIPPNVSPYRQRSVRLQGAIARARLRGATVEAVCGAYGACPRSLYRIVACLPALLVALASLTGRAHPARAAAGACACARFRALLARACAASLGLGPFQGVTMRNPPPCGPCARRALT